MRNKSDYNSNSNERRAFSGPLDAHPLSNYTTNSNDDNLSSDSSSRHSRKSARFNLPPTTIPNTVNNDSNSEAYVEITLDIHDDSVEVHSVQAAGGGGESHGEDPELALLAKKTLEGTKSSSFLRNTSTRVIKQVSQELKRFASLSRRTSARRFDRNKSAASHALKGLKFIASKTSSAAAWPAVEKRFDDLTRNSDGLLPSSLFGECIGLLFFSFLFFLKIF